MALPPETAGAYAAISSLLGSGSAFLGFSSDPDLPKAYLNYHYFDTDHNYITSGFVQVSAGANGNFEELALAFTADQQGYVYIYVANETQADFNVFFDDVEVEHSYSPIVMASSYYPYGGRMTHYERRDAVPGRFGFLNKEWEKEWDVWDLSRREHDPWGRLGFLQVDPLAEVDYSTSPYVYAGGNPISRMDPSGLKWEQTSTGFITSNQDDIARALEGLGMVSSSGRSKDSDNNGFDDDKQSDVVDDPEIAPSSPGNVNGGRFGLTRTNSDGTARNHDGTDIKAIKGTKLKSILPGRVVEVRESFWPGEYQAGSYGNYVIVESTDAHGNIIRLKYNHLDIVNSWVGREITSGEVIGLAGNTGNAGYKDDFVEYTNPAINEQNFHVHIQGSLNGNPVNPENYMPTKFNSQGNSQIPTITINRLGL